ncbi:MAG: class I SAM-dependent methyltransferase [Acidimicrobiales bacterium]
MTTTSGPPTVQDQAGAVLAHAAGYVGHRTIAMGLRQSLVAALGRHPDGLTADGLADIAGVDPFYAGVWCRAAFGAGVLVGGGPTYRLAPQVGTLLLDQDSPAYIGGLFTTMELPEMFDLFDRSLRSGQRTWWDRTSNEWIAAVAGTGRPFYTRLVPAGLERVDGLADRLAAGARILETACGGGAGVVRLATTYPACTVVGADGDAYSLQVAGKRVQEAGVAERVELVHTPLEELDAQAEFDLVTNNISMHECRDLDRVTANVQRALKPGGVFVISDFPFPDTPEGLRTVPGRIMSGIQFFEAQIDDQLVPASTYRELLARHGFGAVGTFELTPMHAVTHGRR